MRSKDSIITQLENMLPTCSGLGGVRIIETSPSNHWNVICVPKQDESLFEPSHLKSILHHNNPGSRICQIIGDSASLSERGAARVSGIVRDIYDSNSTNIILWGFTGSDSACRDVNQVINELIDEDPSTRWSRSYACIVEKDTIQALKTSKFTCPLKSARTKNFILVTGDAHFGDDTFVSDSITDHLYVFEGGIQSFEQTVNCLRCKCFVTMMDRLRDPARTSHFSAASLFRRLIHGKSFVDVKDEYMATLREPLTPTQASRFQKAWELLQPCLPSVISNIRFLES
jgi:hypothetical protein